jgi:hypothetical protein
MYQKIDLALQNATHKQSLNVTMIGTSRIDSYKNYINFTTLQIKTLPLEFLYYQ